VSALPDGQRTGGAAPRRPLPWIPVLLAAALVSYTVVRLQGIGDSLPYDPGPALPTVDVASGSVTETLDRLRDAFLGKRSARVVGAEPRRFACWPLAGIERERALRVLSAMSAQQPGPVCDAVSALVATDEVFVLEQEVFPRTQDERWRYWTRELFAKGGRRRLLVAPIELSRFPEAR